MKRNSFQFRQWPAYPVFLFILSLFFINVHAQPKTGFKILAFYTSKNDPAHISFVNEANIWLPQMGLKHNFSYSATSDWSHLHEEELKKYDLVLFLDTRPESAEQRKAFEKYMSNGGAWIGFHFSAFALTPSAYPQNWDWYHNQFIGAGQYKSNTWRPTSAILKVEHENHPVTQNLPSRFTSSPNEWYSWEKDIRQNPDIQVLLSIDPASFPLGTGPKKHEIWHKGDYPVMWTNTRYRMLYLNMGHNDIDYEGKTNQELSFQFNNSVQNRLIMNAILWLLKNNTLKKAD